jgi:hypothetical protein
MYSSYQHLRTVFSLENQNRSNCILNLVDVMVLELVQYVLGQAFLGVSVKLREVTVSFVMPICRHGTAWLPLDRF